ncbi:hypothetical protein [Histidinibacterium lentulum]|uniref:Uncharacterized protein n=1 Tax=Histidinibacterium lentulum TaxID=2480588 RepID=A0A3N2R5E2_9RHOB|nr:hypothetical protein [Histidinibacterium lentulum]ROU02566.1 hypothetical protein EAT49_09550 [Histidinibacterium lentulum]
MTDVMYVPEHERGQVRLFAVDLPAEEADGWGTAENVAAALGVEKLVEGQWEYVAVSGLEGLGLAGYMEEGLGVDPAQLRDDLPRLAELTGHVLIVLSAAVRGRTLRPRAPLRWIGTYGEPVSVAPMEKLRSASAEGWIDQPRKGPSDAAMSGRIATIAILVLLALVGVMVWVGG